MVGLTRHRRFLGRRCLPLLVAVLVLLLVGGIRDSTELVATMAVAGYALSCDKVTCVDGDSFAKENKKKKKRRMKNKKEKGDPRVDVCVTVAEDFVRRRRRRLLTC